MKIALIVHDLHANGGHSLYTKVLAEELARRHEVTVFANHCEQSTSARWSFQPVRAWRGSALATVHTFPLGLRMLASQFSDFEIRHAQGYCGGQPNVVTAHICAAAYLESLRDTSLRDRLSLGSMAAAEAAFYRRYAGPIIAVSKRVAQDLRDFYKVRGRVEVIPHGIDTARFSRVNREQARASLRIRLGLDEDCTIALYVGDLTKAHPHLKALAGIVPEVQFVIVTRSEKYRWSAPNVHFLPPTSEIEPHYRAADAFVFPTAYDAFGMVVLEAMAAGLPVFSSERAGASELMRSGEDGFVIKLDEWVETTAIKLRDRALLRSVGHEAEQSARRCDWSTVVCAVEQIYLSVAAPAARFAPDLAVSVPDSTAISQ